jgi:hypothetical protein
MAAHLKGDGAHWIQNAVWTATIASSTWTNAFAMGSIVHGDMYFMHGYLSGNNGGIGYHSAGFCFGSYNGQPMNEGNRGNIYSDKVRVSSNYLQFQQTSGANQPSKAHLWKWSTATIT